MYVDFRTAGIKDDLELSVNYGDICHFINDFMRNKTYYLIEAVAENMARELLLKFRKVKAITLEIKKPWAPIGLPLEEVSVSLERSWHEAYIALGSNMNDKKKYIMDAIKALNADDNIEVDKTSSIIETEPYGYTNQDVFLNGVVKVSTLLTPNELLEKIHKIEEEAGRERTIHWGPRTLDLDIIFYDDIVLDSEDLIIPHPDMHNRDFVLKPLCELTPYLRHPIMGKTVSELANMLCESSK